MCVIVLGGLCVGSTASFTAHLLIVQLIRKWFSHIFMVLCIISSLSPCTPPFPNHGHSTHVGSLSASPLAPELTQYSYSPFPTLTTPSYSVSPTTVTTHIDLTAEPHSMQNTNLPQILLQQSRFPRGLLPDTSYHFHAILLETVLAHETTLFTEEELNGFVEHMSLGLTAGNDSCWTPCLHLALLALGSHHLHLGGNAYDPEHSKLDEESLFCRAKRALLDIGEMWRWAEYKTCVILVALCKSFFFHQDNRAEKLTRWAVNVHPEYKEAWAHLGLPGDAQWGHYIWAFSQPHITIVQPPLPIVFHPSGQYPTLGPIDPALYPNSSILAITPSATILSTYKTQTQTQIDFVSRENTVSPLKVHNIPCRSISAPPSLIPSHFSHLSPVPLQSSSSVDIASPPVPIPISIIQTVTLQPYDSSSVYLESESSSESSCRPYAYGNQCGYGYTGYGHESISSGVEVGVNNHGYGYDTPSPSSNLGVNAMSGSTLGSCSGLLGWESTQKRLGSNDSSTKQTNIQTQRAPTRAGANIYHTKFVTFLRTNDDEDESADGERNGEGVVYTSEYKRWYPEHVSFFASYLLPSS